MNGLHFQTTDYTCAPCAILTALDTLRINHPFDEMSLAAEIGAHPTEGTSLSEMVRFSKEWLPYSSHGENSHDVESPCIAVITNLSFEVSKRTHAILVFGMSEGKVNYFDPKDGMIELAKADFEKIWRSENGEYVKYSINFERKT